MQLRLDLDDARHPEARWSPPLCPVPETTYRVEVRALWCPRWQRGTVALEITDDDTREQIAWELRPGAHTLQELANDVRDSVASALGSLDYLDEPF